MEAGNCENEVESVMRYSKKLNGYWEEGYHYYLEFRNAKLTVRDYRRAVMLETAVSYDAAALDRGEPTPIVLEDRVLSRTWDGKMMTEIQELIYRDGELQMLYYYTIMGETRYTLHKVDHGPFDHIHIRDKEYLPRLKGEWQEWRRDGGGSILTIRGNKLEWMGIKAAFHAVSIGDRKDQVFLVPENLIDKEFPGFTSIEVQGETLTCRMLITDVSVPLTVFARPDRIDRIPVPPEALEPMRSTMLPPVERRIPED